MDKWNEVENIMDIRYDGVQRNMETYESYLAMLNVYLTEDGERTTFLKDRIIYNPETQQYSFKFKNRCPIAPSGKISIDNLKLKLTYYDFNDVIEEDGNINWSKGSPEKIVAHSAQLSNYINDKDQKVNGYLNGYEAQEANNDL
jgi:hypothetical protein